MTYELSNDEKRKYVETQLQVYDNHIKQLKDRLSDLINMQAKCNFIAEVMHCQPSCHDRSIRSVQEQLETVVNEKSVWENWKSDHMELWPVLENVNSDADDEEEKEILVIN